MQRHDTVILYCRVTVWMNVIMSLYIKCFQRGKTEHKIGFFLRNSKINRK